MQSESERKPEGSRPTQKRKVEFSLKVRKLLATAGWTIDRHYPMEEIEKAYQAERLNLHSTAERFLSAFGGLIIEYQTVNKRLDVLDFCASDAVKGTGRGGLFQLQRLLGDSTLCPIGYFLYGSYMLLQNVGGKVIGASDDEIIQVGDSGEEAISNILAGTKVEFPVLTPSGK